MGARPCRSAVCRRLPARRFHAFRTTDGADEEDGLQHFLAEHPASGRQSGMSRENPAISIDTLRPQDLPAALDIQKEAYPPFLVEEEGAFLSRLNLTASYCFAAKHGGVLSGYLLAHGWARRSPPALGVSLADGVPSEVLFIHDLAVASSGRGLRVGQQLVGHAFRLATRAGLRSAELIAVEGAADYWQRFGFTEGAASDALLEKLRAYGAHARWMTREITPNR